MNPLGIDQKRIVIASDTNSGELLAMGQLVPLAPGLSEIRSVVVAPKHRGRGIGGALVQHLCSGSPDAVCLTTISRRSGFYRRAGFEVLPLARVPREMVLEVIAGTVAARLLVNDSLVVLRRRPRG